MGSTHRTRVLTILALAVACCGGCAASRASEKPVPARSYPVERLAGWPEVREAVAAGAAAAAYTVVGVETDAFDTKTYRLTDSLGRDGVVTATRRDRRVRVDATLGHAGDPPAEQRFYDAFGPALREASTWARSE